MPRKLPIHEDDPLTGMQQKFVDELLSDVNMHAGKALVRAGYSKLRPNQKAWHLKQQPNIAKAIKLAIQARKERVDLNQDWVVEKLVENVQRAMQLTEVTDRDGKTTGEFSHKGSVANKSLELLGRHLGMFTDNINLKGDILDDLSADDLARLAQALGGAAASPPGKSPGETRH